MRRALLAADVAGLTAAVLFAEAIAGNEGVNELGLGAELLVFAATLPFWLVAAHLFGLYERDEERASHSTADDLVRVFLLVTVGAWTITQAANLSGLFTFDALKMTLFWGGAIVAVTGARVVARQLARRSAAYRQPALVIGGGAVGQLVARKLVMHPEYGIDLRGLIDDHPQPAPSWLRDVPVLGGVRNVPQIVDELEIERVVFAFSRDGHDELLDLIRRLRDAGVQVDIVPRFYEVMGPKIDMHDVEGMAIVGLRPVRLSRTSARFKRAVDVVVAGASLIVLSPLLAVIALLIRRSSPGPVFFRQERLGKDMKPFRIYKFRTMVVDADDAPHRAYIAASMNRDAALSEETLQGNGQFKLERPDAITRIGAFLRRTSLDELPQLLNVLRGDMSLVGPRPCLAWEVEHFDAHHFERFLVPAGLTGLWQVSARSSATFREALDLDVLYAHSASLGLDLRLILRTPLQLLRPKATA